jgi:hypothetical protein
MEARLAQQPAALLESILPGRVDKLQADLIPPPALPTVADARQPPCSVCIRMQGNNSAGCHRLG